MYLSICTRKNGFKHYLTVLTLFPNLPTSIHVYLLVGWLIFECLDPVRVTTHYHLLYFIWSGVQNFLSFCRYYEFNEEIFLRSKVLGSEAMLSQVLLVGIPGFGHHFHMSLISSISQKLISLEIGKTGLFFGYLESNTLLNGTPALFSPAIWMASELRFGWFLNFLRG